MGSPQPALSLREKRVRGSTPKTLACRRSAVALAPPSVSEGARGSLGQAPKVRKLRSHRPPLGAAALGTGTVLSIRQMGNVPWRACVRLGEQPPRVSGLRGLALPWPVDPMGAEALFVSPRALPGRAGSRRWESVPPGVAATPGFVPGRGDERRASLGAAGLQKESGRFASQRRRAVARSRRRAPCNKWEL